MSNFQSHKTGKLVALVSEQPVYNLLSIRQLNPEEVLFVGTRQHHVSNQHLHALVGDERPIHLTEVYDPYDPPAVHKSVSKKLRKLGWAPDTITYDLSGGSKIMSFAIFKLALDNRGRMADLEYIRGRYHMRQYHFEDGLAVLEDDITLPGIITIADYFNAHLPGFESEGVSRDQHGQVDAGGRFETTIQRALAPHLDEVLNGVRPAGVERQIEIDLVVRRGNQVGIIEAKTGANKAGIDQLDTAGNPIYIGEHILKFLVTGRYLSRAHKALALAQQVQVIELPGYDAYHGLPENEERRLVNSIQDTLSGRYHR